MTKRRLERDLEDLTDNLDEVDPDVWLELALRGFADGNDSWAEHLAERRPQGTATHSDGRYTGRFLVATFLAQRVVYDLHTWSLMAESRLKRNELMVHLALAMDQDSAGGDEALSPSMLLGGLYVHYIAYERFAEEVLGIDLITWTNVYPEGPTVVQSAAELLAEHKLQLRWAEAKFNGVDILEWNSTDAEHEDVLTLDDLAQNTYESLQVVWNQRVEETTMD